MNNDYARVDARAQYNHFLPSFITDQGDDQLWHSESAITPASCPEQYCLDPFSMLQARNVRPSRSTTSLSAARPSRVSKQPATRTRRDRKSRTPNLITPELTAPLSVLTRDMSVPLKDIEAYVHRSIETRRAEAEKRGGHVPRPMNSFMLYRSAYAERTKQWCLQNKHQVVSAVSGESWPMEPPEVRNKFNEWADIERANHQSAHPNYKFTPSKVVPNKGARDGQLNDRDASPAGNGHCEEDHEGGKIDEYLDVSDDDRHIPRSVWPKQPTRRDATPPNQMHEPVYQPYPTPFEYHPYQPPLPDEDAHHDLLIPDSTNREYSEYPSYTPFQQYSPYATYPSLPPTSTASSVPAPEMIYLSPIGLLPWNTYSLNHHDPSVSVPAWMTDGVYSHAPDYHTPTAFLDPAAITSYPASHLRSEAAPASSMDPAWDEPMQIESSSMSTTTQQLQEHRRHARINSRTHGILDPLLDTGWSGHVGDGDGDDGGTGSVMPMENHFENAIEPLENKDGFPSRGAASHPTIIQKV